MNWGDKERARRPVRSGGRPASQPASSASSSHKSAAAAAPQRAQSGGGGGPRQAGRRPTNAIHTHRIKYISLSPHTGGRTDGRTDRRTDGQTDRQPNTHTQTPLTNINKYRHQNISYYSYLYIPRHDSIITTIILLFFLILKKTKYILYK
jgi:hypothetical protein